MELPFFYERKQRKTSLVLLLNIVFLTFIWALAHHFMSSNTAESEELFFWIDIGAGSVGLILLSTTALFWFKNATFFIRLSYADIEVYDPLFKEFTWKMKLVDITEIRHTHHKHTGFSDIKVFSLDGHFKNLPMNYHYSRSKLYKALAKVAPHIQLPDNPNLFPQR